MDIICTKNIIYTKPPYNIYDKFFYSNQPKKNSENFELYNSVQI